MKRTFMIYRIIYGLSLAVILAAAVQELRVAGSVSAMLPTYLLAGALAACIFGAIAFRRLAVSALWLLTAVLGGVFTWYGWYGSNAPFILHESHTFDPVAAANEASRYKIQGLAVHVLILLWFVSLPVVRRLSRNSTPLAPR